MALMQRANALLTVDEEDVERYIAKGYSLIDEKTGKVLKASVPTDVGTLQKAFMEHEAKIKELEAENANLKAQLAEKDSAEKPKRTRKSAE